MQLSNDTKNGNHENNYVNTQIKEDDYNCRQRAANRRNYDIRHSKCNCPHPLVHTFV